MAEEAPTRSDHDARSRYWCYHCDKRVEIETLADLPDVVCFDCKNGFVELIGESHVPPPEDAVDDHAFGDQFIQVLRMITQAARDDDAPPSDEDYLRIELDGWGNDDEEEEDVEEDDDERSVEVEENHDGRSEEEIVAIHRRLEENAADNDDDDEVRRRRRDVLRLRLRDFASRSASRRNRILDWAEILMGLEDNSIELRLQIPDSDTYIGNPGDYVDAAQYEALLQNLADSDSGSGGRRGTPPASKSAVEGLETVIVSDVEGSIMCAICKDTVNVGEIGKKLPCGHVYHGDCIVPWLGARNSCPVCRFELPTDDSEYEEEKKRKNKASVGSSDSSS